jgi:amino acid adenylation domain-containing protein
LACVCGEAQLTYAELNRRANQLARHLQGLGVGPEVLVGIALERSPTLLVGLLGVLKAGGAYVPLDPTYPTDRLAYMISDAQARVLLTQQSLAGLLPAATAQVVCVDTQWEAIAQHGAENLETPVRPDQLAYVIYTSGSTGRPKGVCSEHRATLNRLQWMWQRYPFLPGECCCHKTVLGFVDSVWEIFGPLLQGVVTVLIAEPVVKDPRRLVAALAEGGVTRIVLVPSLLRMLLDEHADLAARLPRLSHWSSSGEVLPGDLVERFFERLPGRVLLNLYGSSEVAADATWVEVTANARPGPIPIGRPIDNMQAYILDPQRQPVPIGVTGELYLAGAGVARGYLRRPELTQDRFIENPFGKDAHRVLYKTGDLARYADDGMIEYVGRIDQQVKIRGFRIELGEIEEAMKQHPGVHDVAVIDVGERVGDEKLVAYLVAAPGGAALTTEALRVFLKHTLPEYMVPTSFVTLDALPQLPNGKVDRRELRSRPVTPVPMRTAWMAPRNEIERTLVDIWKALLGSDAVGIHDNFFEAGGHSLMATQLMSRIRERFGTAPRLQDFFEAPTVAEVASAVETLYWARSPGPISGGDNALYERGEI